MAASFRTLPWLVAADCLGLLALEREEAEEEGEEAMTGTAGEQEQQQGPVGDSWEDAKAPPLLSNDRHTTAVAAGAVAARQRAAGEALVALLAEAAGQGSKGAALALATASREGRLLVQPAQSVLVFKA